MECGKECGSAQFISAAFSYQLLCTQKLMSRETIRVTPEQVGDFAEVLGIVSPTPAAASCGEFKVK